MSELLDQVQHARTFPLRPAPINHFEDSLLEAQPLLSGISYDSSTDTIVKTRDFPRKLRPHSDEFEAYIERKLGPPAVVDWTPLGPPEGRTSAFTSEEDFWERSEKAARSIPLRQGLTQCLLAKKMWVSETTLKEYAKKFGGWDAVQRRLTSHRLSSSP
jgi:hypothetical protein